MLGPAGDLEIRRSGPCAVPPSRGRLSRSIICSRTARRDATCCTRRLVVLRLQVLERQVLQLGLHLRHAEAVGQRGVDLPGLQGDALLLLGRQLLQGPHVVQPVGQLDDDDPGILGDRQQQLAVVLDLLLGRGAEGQVADLGQPVDDARDFRPELPGDVLGARHRSPRPRRAAAPRRSRSSPAAGRSGSWRPRCCGGRSPLPRAASVPGGRPR